MDSSSESPIISASLCTGYDGIGLGLKRIFGERIRTAFYVEIEIFAVANLVAKIEEGKLDTAPIWTNLKTFDGKPFRDKIHILHCGYPCQGESVAGKRLGTADPRWLWPFIENIIRTVRPVWCFFENVSGHLTIGYPSVYRSLRNLGYSVEAGLFSAAECGANHIRPRLYILAHAHGLWGLQPQRSVKIERKRPDNNIEKRVSADSMCIGHPGVQQLQKYVEQTKTWGTGTARAVDKPFDDSFGWRTWPTKPFVCGKNDGRTTRVDRLRLLGNGVVPQCAELAFRTLIRKF